MTSMKDFPSYSSTRDIPILSFSWIEAWKKCPYGGGASPASYRQLKGVHPWLTTSKIIRDNFPN